MSVNLKNVVPQLCSDYDEIEAERGQERGRHRPLKYLESTKCLKEHKETEVTSIKQELESSLRMNLENGKDEETMSELQTELDELSKKTWRLKNDESFKKQKAKFVHIVGNIIKLLNGLKVEWILVPLPVPSDKRQLKTCWETVSGAGCQKSVVRWREPDLSINLQRQKNESKSKTRCNWKTRRRC